jgi:hypothetical protein
VVRTHHIEEDIVEDMRLTTFLIADHAEACNGKLYITGGCWDTLFAGGFPTQHPHLSIAAALYVPWRATNQSHTIAVDLVDADGNSVLREPIQGKFEAGRPPGMRPGDNSNLVLVFNIDGLIVEKPGRYEWVFMVDGTDLGRIGFKVVERKIPSLTG